MTPIKTIDEVVADPHLRAREMFVPVQLDGASIEVFGSPIKLSGTPALAVGAAPALGQHNREVYVDWLGMSPERLRGLVSSGVV